MLAIRDVVAAAHGTNVLNETDEPPNRSDDAKLHELMDAAQPVLNGPEMRHDEASIILLYKVHSDSLRGHIILCRQLESDPSILVYPVPPCGGGLPP